MLQVVIAPDAEATERTLKYHATLPVAGARPHRPVTHKSGGLRGGGREGIEEEEREKEGEGETQEARATARGKGKG
jgi:hypothetical protein